MSDLRISKGPWHCDPPQMFGPEGRAAVWQEESGGAICYVGDPYPRGDNHPYENLLAISAVPELLRVADEVRGYRDVLPEWLMDLADAAYAKATGEAAADDVAAVPA